MTWRIKYMADAMGRLPAPQSAEAAIADWIMGNLIGYRENSVHRSEDKEFLMDAIQAYAKLLQDSDVKVEYQPTTTAEVAAALGIKLGDK